MSFHETMNTFDNVRHSSLMSSEFVIENTAYQQVAIEEMERRAFAVTGIHPIKDKRARLRVAARYIKTGRSNFRAKDASSFFHSSSASALKSTTTWWMLWSI
jgi:hypothetical protein